jgi:hypothetical protein
MIQCAATHALAALSLHRPQSASQLARESGRGNPLHPEEEAVNEVEDDEMAHLVANRQGEVLGPHAILKEDHFPGAHPESPPYYNLICVCPRVGGRGGGG